jgi:hypothetical protein
MVAIRVMCVMMVSVPVVAVMLPVGVSTEFVVIVSVSASVSLIAIAIFVVIAIMVATLEPDDYRPSELDSDGYLRLGFRRQRQADGNDETEPCKCDFLEHLLFLHCYFVLAIHRRFSCFLDN